MITVGDEQPTAEAVAIVGNRIARVGGNDEIRDEVGPATRVVDLEGRTLLPGFKKDYQREGDESLQLAYAFGIALLGDRAFLDSVSPDEFASDPEDS